MRKVLIPLKSEPYGLGLRFGSDTRAHCLNTGQLRFSGRCLFLNQFNTTGTLKSEPDGQGLRFGSDTRTHYDCLNLNTVTGQLKLSSRCLFLNRVAVRRHVAAPQLCFNAKLGYREIRVQMAAWPGNCMAGAGGSTGQAPDVGHQQPGETTWRFY